ncbi:cell wall hydrolase [uncultured Brevundimonas sp.]|uniref:cell wall hydrolase n=1 Tax=uncultured Brevundimonas sp. TaxID=213418 RepID=UPI0025E785D9|nr:cell wall hydrolase [uncultured Brevundimonas sp.]
MTSLDLFAQAEAGAQAIAPRPVTTATQAPTDIQRRADLNARLRGMIAEGKGGRLADATPPSRSVRARDVRATPVVRRPQNTVRTSTVESAATIAPPAYNPSKARPLSAARGYRAPRLDLSTPANVPGDPLACLTQAIYYEARNESEEGQAAVAEVVLNRAGSGRYPRDICQVVYQRNSRTCQFTFTCDGSIGRSPINMTAWARAERIARSVYAGEAKALLPRSSVNYHANYVRPTWSRRMERVRRIGAHIFYGSPLNGGVEPGAEAPRAPQGLTFVKNDAIERAYAMLTAPTDKP